MLAKSLRHAASHDPNGQATIAHVLAVAPLRFGLDVGLLGPTPFTVALSVATAYIVGTFVATHQLGANHAFIIDDAGAAPAAASSAARTPDCWMARQLRATNNVLAGDAVWSAACGGINNHIEHHLFPQVSSDALAQIVPVVREFAAEKGLPYRSYTPAELAWRHVRFLAGWPGKLES